MIEHEKLTGVSIAPLIRCGIITLGGNRKLRIYGSLHCRSGKRMKKENRVFFSTGQEAIDAGYRPCGHCMKQKYQWWKKSQAIK